MIALQRRFNAFIKLGEKLNAFDSMVVQEDPVLIKLKLAIDAASNHNPWFTPENVQQAVYAIAESLQASKLDKWIKPYFESLEMNNTSKKVGIVMAGNIPLVGFHDFLCVLMSGHHAICKLSSDDNQLLPIIASLLFSIDPEFENFVTFEKGKLNKFDAIIATGSNNTARYFEYYFGKYPHIIRKNRNGIAVLSGKESTDQIELLGKDIFSYFGLGCRSISKIFVPKDYNFDLFFESIQSFAPIINHHKYNNNYDYYKSIFLVNKVKHLDNGFLLVKEDQAYASAPSVLYFEYYDKVEVINQKLDFDKEMIQCIIGDPINFKNALPYGKAQHPELWDYADKVDTIKFLLQL